jgi:hypothetical protein
MKTDSKVAKEESVPEEMMKGLLEEYGSLKDEIHNTQGQRMQILSLMIGAFGALLSITGGVVLGAEKLDPIRRLGIAIGGASAIYSILIPCLIMMITTQQTVQRLGEYIRLFIEPMVPGLNWEHHWHNYKRQYEYRGGLRGMGGVYYFLSAIALFLPVYALILYPKGWPAILLLLPLFVWSLYLTYDLQKGVSEEWKWSKWEDYNG